MRSRLMILLGCAAALGGCGSFVESNDQISRATLGEAGGALQLDAFSLDVPAHALTGTVTLSLRHASFEAPDGHAYVLEPADAAFDVGAPGAITIAYDAAVYPHPSEIFVAAYTGSDWHMLPAAGAAEPGAAHATTTHAGTFGLVHCPGGT